MAKPTCEACRIAHEPERECADVLRGLVADLTRRVGAEVVGQHADVSALTAIPALKAAITALVSRFGKQGVCRACRATVYFVRHANGALCPYTAEGVSHFRDCSQPQRFSKS